MGNYGDLPALRGVREGCYHFLHFQSFTQYFAGWVACLQDRSLLRSLCVDFGPLAQ